MDHKEDLSLDRPIWRRFYPPETKNQRTKVLGFPFFILWSLVEKRLEKIAEFLRPFYPREDVERAFGILRYVFINFLVSLIELFLVLDWGKINIFKNSDYRTDFFSYFPYDLRAFFLSIPDLAVHDFLP